MSNITREIAAAALIVFAGQTVTADEVGEYIEQQYALLSGGRRQTFGSFMKVRDAVEAATEYRGSMNPATTPSWFTFPAA